MANANETKLKSADSVRNCFMRLILCDPTTFRNPTSLARFADFAVERLIKLIQAIEIIKIAIAMSRYKKLLLMDSPAPIVVFV